MMEENSMSKKVNVWGREFELEVQYEANEGEELLRKQIDALDSFMNSTDILLSDPDAVIKYCLSNNPDEITEPINNIFKYVIPTAILIRRDMDDNVVLLCDYKFDYEDGIAIVFEKNILKEICSQSQL